MRGMTVCGATEIVAVDGCSTKRSMPTAPSRATREQFAKDAINEALALFQRRRTLRVLWDLRGGALTFRALQARCGDLSPTVLNQRLAELREVALVAADAGGYRLSAIAEELIVAFAPLSQWAQRWKRALG
jgi:DNA-binding HxlR family transcriptional regulator